jgi:hypothetical protein
MDNGFRHYVNPDELEVLRRFIAEWGDLPEDDHKILVRLVDRFSQTVEEQDAREMREVRRLAAENLASDDLAVDDDAEVLKTENGYWVQTWTWVPQD